MLRCRAAGEVFLRDMLATKRVLRIIREMCVVLYVTVECRAANDDADEEGTGEMGTGGCI